MSNTTIQLDKELYDYLLSVSLKEDEVLTKLRKATSSMPGSNMQIAPDQGQFMAMLIKGARTSIFFPSEVILVARLNKSCTADMYSGLQSG